MNCIWTVWAEYSATGEGQTLLAWVGYASDAPTARASFDRLFGGFFAAFAIAEEGVVRNDVVDSVLPAATLDRIRNAAGKANVEAYAQVHFNSA